MARDLSQVVPLPADAQPPAPRDPDEGTWRDPRQYDPAYLSQVGGQAVVDVYEGLSQLPKSMYDIVRGFMERQRQKSPAELRGTADPYDTAAYDAAIAAIEGAMEDPKGTALSARDALAEYFKESVSGPGAMTEFLAENLVPLPRLPRDQVAKRDIFIGKSSPSFDKEANEQAQRLEKEGVSRQEIWQQTGNFRGQDGKWRQEVSDQDVMLDLAALEAKSPYMATKPLAERINDFIQATREYPKAQDLTPEKQAAARKVASTLTRIVSPSKKPQLFDLGDIVSAPTLEQAYPGIISKSTGRRLPDEDSSLGQVDRGIVSLLAFDPYEVRSAMFGPETRDPRSTLVHELQHVVQEKEGFSPGGSPGFWQPGGMYTPPGFVEKAYYDALYRSQGKDFDAHVANARAGREVMPVKIKVSREERKKAREVVDRIKRDYSPFNMYQDLAGEAEARAAARRMDLTPEQRRSRFPEFDFDVPFAEQFDPRSGLVLPGTSGTLPKYGVPKMPGTQESITYQGSPFRFDPTESNPLGEFDISKMGKGVGQQNRGPGTYIAENPKVASRYRIPGGRLPRDGSEPPRGYLYTVDLPDPMIDKMIDLDAPIKNQPKIRETLLKIADDGVLPTESADYLRLMLTTSDKRFQKTPLTGFGLIAVPRQFGGIFNDATEANTLLQQYGIPGSKWKDDISRGPDKGTRNFVVFPGEEKNLKILSREGPEGQASSKKFPRVDELERFPLGPTSIRPRAIAQDKPLFRETSPAGLNDFLRDDRTFGYNNVFVTDDPTLALGQGTNKGVLVQFRPNSVSGELSAKPGAGVIGGQEYTADVFAPRSVERVTFTNPRQGLKGLVFGARQNLMRNFDRVDNEDGSVTFVRKTED